MDKFQLAMGEMVLQYIKAYSRRHTLMKQMRAMKYVKTEVSYPHVDKPWYAAMKKDQITLDFGQKGLYFYTRTHLHGGCTATFFKSARGKKKEIQFEVDRNDYYKDADHSRGFWPTEEQHKERIAQLEAIPVHPFAKQILQYSKLERQFNALTKKQHSLREAIRQMNKLRLGIVVNFGDGHYASDRITSVAMGERTYNPIDFINHVAFELKVLS